MKKLIITKIFAIIIYILLNINLVNAYTDVTGPITTSTGWTLSGSPYVISSDLVIESGVTLNIDAGVVVKVKPSIKITSYGVINAIGTSSNYIYFTAYDDTSVDATVGDGVVSTSSTYYSLGDYWKYLKLDGAGSNNSILKYVKIKYYGNAKASQYNSSSYRYRYRYSRRSRSRRRKYYYYYRPDEVYRSGLQVVNSDATIDSNYILYGMINGIYTRTSSSSGNIRTRYYQDTSPASNVSGLYISGGNPEIINNTISSSKEYGMYVTSGGAHIKNNTLSSNSDYGLYYLNGTSLIENNLIENNAGGIYVGNGTPNIKVNHIENNGTYGIYTQGGTPNINNNYLIKGHSYGIYVANGTPNINNNFNKIDEPSVAVINGNTHGVAVAGGSPTIDTNRIESNSTYGIYLINGSATVTDNNVKNNSSHGIYQSNGTHTIDSNDITYNNLNGIHVVTGTSDIKNNIVSNNSGIGIDIEALNSTLDNNSITSNGNGIYINNGGGLITNNTITGNTGYGIISNYLDPYLSGANNTISGNGTNNYFSHQFNIIGTSGTIKDDTLDIVIDRNSSLEAGKTLTLVPGNKVKFHNGIYANVYGTLISEGTSSEKILYTSINDGAGSPTPGNWEYLKVLGTASNNTAIEYSEFKYGNNALHLNNTSASVLNSNFVSNNTGIYVDAGTADISNNTFSGNVNNGIYVNSGTPVVDTNIITGGSYGIRVVNDNSQILNNDISLTTSNGIYIDNGAPIIDNNSVTSNANGIYENNGSSLITNNTITGNTGYGIISNYLDAYLDGANNTISGNGTNNYYSHKFNILSSSGTLRDNVLDIIIDRNSSLDAGKTLTLVPGNVIKFHNGIYTNVYGTLISEGTDSEKIIYTSINDGTGTPAPGNWNYFKISGTTSNNTSINYSEFKYGTNALHLYNTSANVSNSNFELNTIGVYVDAGTANILNNTMSGSVNYGIYINSGTPIIDTNIITGGSYGIRVINNNPQILNNNISGTTTNGVYIDNGGSIIDNNQIVNNSGNGLNINEGTTTITNNTITGNTLFGLITSYLDPYHDSNSNIIENNGQNGYYVHYFNLNILDSGTFDFSEQELIVDRNSTISSGKEVILTEGSIIKFKNNIYLKSNGVIKANGTADSKIIFTSINDNTVGLPLGTGSPAKGNWQYLNFYGAGSNGSLLDNIELRYAGSYGIYLQDSSTTVQNSKIEENSGDGINISGSSVSTIQNNIIQKNNKNGINTSVGNHIIDQNTITTNSNNGINVVSGNPVITNSTISNNNYSGININSGNPSISINEINNNSQYAINSYNLQIRVGENEVNEVNTASGNILGQYVSRSVDIVDAVGDIDGTKSDVIVIGNGYLASGKEINFAEGSIIKVGNGIAINVNGKINANGTPNSKVVFTSINDNTVGQVHGSVTPAKGNWQYININGTGTNGSNLDNIKLRYTGTYGLLITNSSSTLTNSTVEQTNGYGVYVNSSNESTIQNNIIQNNSKDGIYTMVGNHVIDQNDIINNSNYGINVISGNPVITGNDISNNLYSGIYIKAGNPSISNNEINNNSQYAINSYNLQIRVGENEVDKVNTSSGNTLGQYVSRSIDIVDTTGDIDGSNSDVVIIGNGYLSSGKTINFGTGSIIKVGNGIALNSYGVLNTSGSEDSKVVFTSINDNDVGQELGSGNPGKGNWQYILLNGPSTNGSVLDNMELRYAGSYGINITNSSTTIQNSKIEQNSGKGVYINSNVPVTIHNTIIQNNNNEGIYNYSGNHIFSENDINNNLNNGIYLRLGNSEITDNNISDNSYHGINLNSGNPSITGNTINNNLQSGIYIGSGNPVIDNNEFNENSQYAINSYNLQIRVGENQVSKVNSASGNTLGQYASRSLDIIDSTGNVDGSINDVIIIGNGYLPSGKTINFEEGSVIKVGAGNYINSNGVINANGTTGAKVVFTSINDNSVGESIGTGEPNKGDWQYIFFNGTGTNGSIFDNTEVRYGGSRGIYIQNSSTTIQNSKIEENNGYGIYIYGTYVSNIKDNIIQNNSNDGIYNHSGNHVITGNTIKSNLSDGIYVNSGTPNIRNNNMSLNTNYGLIAHNLDPFLSSFGNEIRNNGKNTYYAHYFDISGTDETITFNIYIDRDSTFGSGKKIKLFPGTIVKLGSNVDITILGTLESIGTTVDNIIFTSVNDNSVGPQLNTSNPSRGNWGGINFNNSTSNDSILKYTQVKYAYKGIETSNANINIQNSVITESSSYGISFSGLSPNISNSAIFNNSSYGIYCASGTPNLEYNLFYQSNNTNCTTGSGNLINVDPLYENNTSFTPSDLSPLIGTGNPDLGNHPASGNRYDIGVVETGVEATLKVLKASIIKVGDGLIDLNWSIIEDPSGGVDKPIINNQGTEQINFRIKYRGTYKVQLDALQGEQVIDSGTKEFTVQ